MKFENVLRITQWGHGEGADKVPLYVFTVPAKAIMSKETIHRRTPQRRDGYQRGLADARLGKGKLGVAGYMLNQMGVFPTSVLVNVRKKDATLDFEERNKLSANIVTGDLVVPDDVTWYVLDGQHRLEGLKIAMREKEDLAEYPVILTMTNEDLFYEMLTFYLVNSRQKAVPTGLAYRILQRMLYDKKAPKWIEQTIMTGADRRKAIAATIVDYLDRKPNSPFQGRIQEVGEPRKPEDVTTDATLTRYVAKILRETAFSEMYDEDVADLLASYWGAIKDTYPDCFQNPIRYVLLETLGLSSLSKVFPTIHGYCARDGSVSKENMQKYLGYLQEETPEHTDPDFQKAITESWWHKTDGPGIIHGTGEGHYAEIARMFAQKISIVVQRERKKTEQ
mgnify:CR=1 FL=1